MGADIRDAVYGCLIGGAVGDSLGAPVEGWTHEQIQDEYGTFEEFKQYYMPYSNMKPGTITSDTTMRHYLCLAVVEHGGRPSPDDFADVLRDHLNPDRVWVNEEVILKKLSVGINPWDAGRGAIPDNKATSAITPIGIINAGAPTQAYQDGFTIASMLQDGHNCHVSATVAAGIAEAVLPDATVDSVVDVMFAESSGVAARALDLALGYAAEADSVDDLVDTLYDRFLDWRWPAVQWDREKYHEGEVFSANPLETVPVAVAVFALCDGEADRSIVEGVNYGRDSDAVATVAGSLAGALRGADAIRDDWKETCEEQNRDFFEELEGDPTAGFRSMADRLIHVLEAEQSRAAERADTLTGLLEETDGTDGE